MNRHSLALAEITSLINYAAERLSAYDMACENDPDFQAIRTAAVTLINTARIVDAVRLKLPASK